MNKNKLKSLMRLHQKKYRQVTQTYLIEGEHLINEAYRAGVLKEIYSLSELSAYPKVTKEIVDEQTLNKLAFSVTPQPMIGLCMMREIVPDVHAQRLVALENIQDPGNLGTIIRTALAFNYDGILLGEGCVELYNDKVLRSTQGALFHIPILECKHLLSNIKALKATHCIMTTDLKGATYDPSYQPSSFVIVFGNEGQGLSEAMRALSDRSIYLPIKNIDSLNVAVTAGILLYLFQI